MENGKQLIKPQKPRKKTSTIKNSELSRVARLLNEFLMLQLGAKTTLFSSKCWLQRRKKVSEHQDLAGRYLMKRSNFWDESFQQTLSNKIPLFIFYDSLVEGRR